MSEKAKMAVEKVVCSVSETFLGKGLCMIEASVSELIFCLRRTLMRNCTA